MEEWFGKIGIYCKGIFKGIAGQLGVNTAEFLKHFVETDMGKLAVDAVQYVQSKLPATEDGVAERDAAVAKLKTDAAAAGHDLASFAESTLIWFIETAYQAVLAKAATNDPTGAGAGEHGTTLVRE